MVASKNVDMFLLTKLSLKAQCYLINYPAKIWEFIQSNILEPLVFIFPTAILDLYHYYLLSTYFYYLLLTHIYYIIYI